MTENEDFVREDHCPGCGRYLDSATQPLDPASRPIPGDLSVCVYCYATLEYDSSLKLQLVDERSLSESEKALIVEMRRALKKLGPPPSARQSPN